MQTEIPLVKQHLSDQLWAVRGEKRGAPSQSADGRSSSIVLRPSSAPDIEHGCASIARFFPGGRDDLAALDEAIVLGALGPPAPGKARCFEISTSTAGQLYELMAGHDRFVADLRPLVGPLLSSEARGLSRAIPTTSAPRSSLNRAA